ncbi:hypothetical protein OSSY52_16840 [Tepiditoga spiralis]|uniref:Peptidase C45 hydrolase domain-containing protein n=1 Tax=Tepiditoga spiralis TaxID=2108365 RepID=A0A7G1G9B3_9BACT|nr:C45 family peptidase [Tepiditoga spiralis]BBE31543.1 hypothetical protein OSSY52_16840 [Tepiditoga spiralis]
MKKIALSISFVILLILVYIGYLFLPINYTVDKIQNKNFKIEKYGNIKVVYLSGNYEEIGYQHGLALKDDIHSMELKLKNIMKDTNFFENIAIRYTLKSYFKNIPVKYKKEMAEISKASKVSLDTIILLNVYDEIYNLYGCTNAAIWGKNTENGEIIHGRNLDYMYVESIWDSNVLFVYDIKDENGFLSLNFPGIIGVLTGTNDKGISLGSMTSESVNESSSGIPTGILYRMILEKSNNVDDVEKILRSTKRTIGNNLMIGSKKDKKAVVFEFDSKYLEKIENDNIITSTNHFTKLKNKKLDYLKDTKTRKEEAYSKLNHEKLSAKDMIDVLRFREGDNPICKWGTVQSVVFLPTSSQIYVAANDSPYAPTGRYFKFKYENNQLSYLKTVDYIDDYLDYISYISKENLKSGKWKKEKILSILNSFLKYKDIKNVWKKQDIIFYLDDVGLKNEAQKYIKDVIDYMNDNKIKYENSKNKKDYSEVKENYIYSLMVLTQVYNERKEYEKVRKYANIGLNIENSYEDEFFKSILTSTNKK